MDILLKFWGCLISFDGCICNHLSISAWTSRLTATVLKQNTRSSWRKGTCLFSSSFLCKSCRHGCNAVPRSSDAASLGSVRFFRHLLWCLSAWPWWKEVEKVFHDSRRVSKKDILCWACHEELLSTTNQIPKPYKERNVYSKLATRATRSCQTLEWRDLLIETKIRSALGASSVNIKGKLWKCSGRQSLGLDQSHRALLGGFQGQKTIPKPTETLGSHGVAFKHLFSKANHWLHWALIIWHVGMRRVSGCYLLAFNFQRFLMFSGWHLEKQVFSSATECQRDVSKIHMFHPLVSCFTQLRHFFSIEETSSRVSPKICKPRCKYSRKPMRSVPPIYGRSAEICPRLWGFTGMVYDIKVLVLRINHRKNKKKQQSLELTQKHMPNAWKTIHEKV